MLSDLECATARTLQPNLDAVEYRVYLQRYYHNPPMVSAFLMKRPSTATAYTALMAGLSSLVGHTLFSGDYGAEEILLPYLAELPPLLQLIHESEYQLSVARRYTFDKPIAVSYKHLRAPRDS